MEVLNADNAATSEDKTMLMRSPMHPGLFLRTEVIEAHHLSVTAAAKILRVSRSSLSSLLHGKADLSGEMALRFEKAFGVNMDALMRMQTSYDVVQTRRRAGTIRVHRETPMALCRTMTGTA